MSRTLITKQLFLTSQTCPAYAWTMANNAHPKPLSAYDKFIFVEGLQVQNKARMLFPDGTLITGDNITAFNKTKQLLKDPSLSTLFEATFIIHKGITKADILLRKPSGWHLMEIKSGLDPKGEYLEDLAYTTMVCLQAGLTLTTCSLLLLSRNYQFGMPVSTLFQEHDCTEEALTRANEFWQDYDTHTRLVLSETRPAPALMLDCKACEELRTCFQHFPDYSIFDLPRLHHTKFCQLREKNITCLTSIPNDFDLTPTQHNVKRAIQTGRPYLDKEGLKAELEKLHYPLFFLDFETVMTALPLYPDTSPYTQIPTQYSLHVVLETGQIQHHEFLADPKKDCRRQLVEKLISHCENEGTILMYTPFEKTVLNGLMMLYPDLSNEIQSIVSRLIDLCQILRQNYYHPQFHGSYSIKNVLPVMVPELSYDRLEINNGSDAVAQFAMMARGQYNQEEKKQVKRHLLEYCKMDTLAMVKVWERLRGMV